MEHDRASDAAVHVKVAACVHWCGRLVEAVVDEDEELARVLEVVDGGTSSQKGT